VEEEGSEQRHPSLLLCRLLIGFLSSSPATEQEMVPGALGGHGGGKGVE
jgi:hypothetical protein